MNRKTKISLISVLTLLGVSAVFGVGFICGIIYVTDPSCSPERRLSERHKKIQISTESYRPTCEELKNKGIPRLVRQNNDYFFVNVHKDFYHVFGINVDPAEPPVMFWWGAGLNYTLEQNCAGETNNTTN